LIDLVKGRGRWQDLVNAVMSLRAPQNALDFLDYNIIIYLFTAVGLLPGGSDYFTSKQNMKLVTTRFKSGGLHEKHVVAT